MRNKAKGIIQADDIGIVRKETISNLSEEVMIATPGYWLAPCLVALSAWINLPLALRVHGFGVVFQPRTFSAQELSTSELLRTL